jgi:hypothetical protein
VGALSGVSLFAYAHLQKFAVAKVVAIAVLTVLILFAWALSQPTAL